ncbi:hypothetical protein Tco_0003358 [Tanacetum coccineum]
MQRLPLFESGCFIYWKNRFETYAKVKDLDLWHIILNGDFPSIAKNEVTHVLEVVPFEQQDDDLKRKFAKNNKAKMVLYNALPKKEYERIFMCKTAKDIWQSLLITYQDESIDSGFARFNTIITSLKALDKGFSSKNYFRKFLRALHPKWRAKVMAIEESKDLSSLALDELIDNLKVHKVVTEKDFEIYRGKKKRVKSIALKAKKDYIGDETSTSGSDDEEYVMAERVIENALDAVIQIISLAILQSLLATTIKRPLLEVTLDSSHYSDNASSLDDDSMPIEYDNLCKGYSKKRQKRSKTDKTKHEMEKRKKVKVKVNPKSQQVKAEDETEEILIDQAAPI